jgi:predicted DNA-binding transcriptional regulator YafY
MAAPKFVQRIARLPEVLNVLAAYPGGLPLRRLAAQFDVDVETMRQDLVTYLELESWGWSYDIFRRPAIEFVQPEVGYTTDGSGGTIVRIVQGAAPGLGVEHLSAGDLAIVYTAGMALLDVDDSDTDLAEALGVIAETMYGEPTTQPQPGNWNRFLPLLQQAQEERRRVKIVYSRTWRPGVTERTIEPLRLTQTHRGWEIDAGPVGPEGNLRTYILSNVRAADLLHDTFEPPAGFEALLERQRKTTTVRMELTQDSRWAADMYAERVTVLEEDEAKFIADLELLPPAGDRVGLIVLASGTETRVLSPSGMLSEAMGIIDVLLRHHSAQL